LFRRILKMLKGKTAIITGGTRGIGFAIAKKYLDNGANVVITGSRKETVDSSLSKLTEYGDRVMGIWPNLCNTEEVTKAFNAVKEKYGSVDILANNAGISSRTSLYDYTLEEFEKILDINIKAVFVCTQVAAKIMKEQGGGSIINTSSMVSLYGQPSGCGYPTTKYAVNGLTKSLARELAKDNIRVNAVAPGVTKTDMVEALPQAMVDRISAGIPMGRVGEPEDVANAFLYLGSDMASYVTGTLISVDGAAMC
jgi:3-oxoacyl-[acyl-carrier protein] reductase/7-alpha-hydroxysteroid dehydrogenase